MKVNRTALQKAVVESLDAHKTRHEQRTVEWAAELDRYEREWAAEHNPAWAEATKKINRKIRQGKPVTRDDVPVRRYGTTPDTYEEPRWIDRTDGRRVNRPDAHYRPPRELVALNKTLELISDEEVTPTGLRAIGLTGSVISKAFAQLGTVETA